MIYDRELLRRLDELHADRWEGEVFRHMFGDYPPDRENQRGARWNPAETPAIYTSVTREVALAEAAFPISMQPVRPRADRTIARSTRSVSSCLPSLISRIVPAWPRSESPQRIWRLSTMTLASVLVVPLRGSGTMVLVPSARADGVNLVIFPNAQRADYEFRVLDSEVLEGGMT